MCDLRTLDGSVGESKILEHPYKSGYRHYHREQTEVSGQEKPA
jgi:hypothetical protein